MSLEHFHCLLSVLCTGCLLRQVVSIEAKIAQEGGLSGGSSLAKDLGKALIGLNWVMWLDNAVI